MCLKDSETYLHLWKCEQLKQVNENIIVLIWEYRNVKLADLEHQRGINAKMKKSANKSKLVINKLDKIISSRWELWNSLVFDKGELLGSTKKISALLSRSPRPLEKIKSGSGRGRKSERKKPEGTIKQRFNVGGRNARL
ncbi:hypothetical protein C1646_674449 [Rhizophagus diaphanus]|nr:hypothetical protein C1646_674449 [Rhizophagus diaphanus] [Rhizophagus sp. MUCL 43196]